MVYQRGHVLVRDEDVRDGGHDLSTPAGHDVNGVSPNRCKHHVHLADPEACISATQVQEKRRTPTPLVKRHMRLITKPTVPPTYAVVKPARVIEMGMKMSPPIHDARRRSSGTHTPLRCALARRTTRSERRPEIGAPTERVNRIGYLARPKRTYRSCRDHLG